MIEINNLSFARGNFLIFKDVSFTVKSGEVMILRGPNGKGKTTLLSNITQLLDPLSGEVKYQGIKIDSYIASQCFLYLGENHFAYDQLSLNQNIDYWLSIHNVNFNKAIRDQSIKFLFGELNLNKKFYQLSFGQKKKLQLLLLMLVNKPIWILDDPFNGLDNDTIVKITTLLSKKTEKNGAIIIASHQNLAIPHRTYELA
ncbi:heme ABC exporter ATP-binding protein CcmA [Alphaproteobacteria bacterium]|jgi:heme exporter protein A|nr:heme ABC exporter ATP-binding protein CcmA [Alphaproteobacteria bacterium]MDB2371026.1 heme ABC exporter ATP-binding protein CcmA [Alphaproteobacteria bacterium]